MHSGKMNIHGSLGNKFLTTFRTLDFLGFDRFIFWSRLSTRPPCCQTACVVIVSIIVISSSAGTSIPCTIHSRFDIFEGYNCYRKTMLKDFRFDITVMKWPLIMWCIIPFRFNRSASAWRLPCSLSIWKSSITWINYIQGRSCKNSENSQILICLGHISTNDPLQFLMLSERVSYVPNLGSVSTGQVETGNGTQRLRTIFTLFLVSLHPKWKNVHFIPLSFHT